MKLNQLGTSNIEVSEICLGSMNWGTQNSEAEGHQQIDYALSPLSCTNSQVFLFR